eukprot:scaffold99816_cov71-Phaeocystis_antarctica.AAC.4
MARKPASAEGSTISIDTSAVFSRDNTAGARASGDAATEGAASAAASAAPVPAMRRDTTLRVPREDSGPGAARARAAAVRVREAHIRGRAVWRPKMQSAAVLESALKLACRRGGQQSAGCAKIPRENEA